MAYLHMTLNLFKGHGQIHAHVNVECLGKVEGQGQCHKRESVTTLTYDQTYTRFAEKILNMINYIVNITIVIKQKVMHVISIATYTFYIDSF